jgi:flagellar basal body-associated protein FliL
LRTRGAAADDFTLEQQSTNMGHDAHGQAAPPATKAGGGLLAKLLPAVIVVSVVTGEGLAAYMLMPSAADTAAAAKAALEAHAPEPEDDHHGHKEPELEEVDLEVFKITSFQPASSITLRIEFHLFGVVKADKAADFEGLVEQKKNRLRDNVMSIIRSADMNDLTDPSLALIKRKILETTNKALGKPLLQGVMFSEFTFLEQ